MHLVYVTLIRPNADAILQQQAELAASGEPFVQDRSLYVVLRDYEQESCFILMFWAIAIMGFKARTALGERSLLNEDFIQISEGMSILPEDTRVNLPARCRICPTKATESLLPRTLLAALHRFSSTRNVQDVSEAVKVCV